MDKTKILITLLIIISLNCKISNENKGSYNITVNENEKYKEIKTLSDGVVYDNINNYLLKVYPESFLKLENNKINLIKGKIFYTKNSGSNNYKSYNKNLLLNYDIENKIMLDNEQGKVCFYRLKLPDKIEIDSEIEIIFYVNENKKTVKKKLKKNLNFIFSLKNDNYYGFFIPLNVYWNIEGFKIYIKIKTKNNSFMEIIDEKKVIQKVWDKQIINFNKKKYDELNNYNKEKYNNEKKERDIIYNTFNPKLLMKDFSYPVENIKISSEFGLIRIWKIYKRIFSKDIHNGIDIVNPLDTNVYAPADGIIKFTKLCELIGNLIIIDHGFSVYTEYYHLNKISVAEGTFVKKGEVIGTVGMTGASTGNHLHWGLRINGYLVDPRSLLKINDIFLP